MQCTLIPDSPMSGSEFVGSSGGFAEGMVDLAGDIAFDAAHDFVFGFAFGEAAGDVVTGGLVAAHAHDQDDVQGAVGVALSRNVRQRPITYCGPTGYVFQRPPRTVTIRPDSRAFVTGKWRLSKDFPQSAEGRGDGNGEPDLSSPRLNSYSGRPTTTRGGP
jgi:hypothetical protein